MCDLMWTPFDSRFKELLKHMKYYRELLQAEMILVDIQITITQEERMIEARNKQEQVLADLEQRQADLLRAASESFASQSEQMRSVFEQGMRGTFEACFHCPLYG